MTFTAFENIYNTTAIDVFEGDPFDILEEFFDLGSFAYKQRAPLLCPSKFDGTRCLDNHVESRCIGIDIDKGITMEEAKARLKSLGLASFIYTTASSRSMDRFRVFIKFSRPVTLPHEYKAIWKVMNAAFNDAVDLMTQHAACMFYAPSFIRGADNKMFRTEGSAIDVDHYVNIGLDIIETVRPTYTPVNASSAAYSVPAPLSIDGWVTYDPEQTILKDSPFVRPSYVDDYLNLPCGAHYHGLYSFMNKVSANARSRNTIVSVRHLTLLAQQLDILDGGYYTNRPIQREAENVVRFIYGGEVPA